MEKSLEKRLNLLENRLGMCSIVLLVVLLLTVTTISVHSYRAKASVQRLPIRTKDPFSRDSSRDLLVQLFPEESSSEVKKSRPGGDSMNLKLLVGLLSVVSTVSMFSFFSEPFFETAADIPKSYFKEK